jgi:hypothetical protein
MFHWNLEYYIISEQEEAVCCREEDVEHSTIFLSSEAVIRQVHSLFQNDFST